MAEKKTTTSASSVEQLRTDLAAKRQDLIEAKRSHAAGELVNPRVLGVTRKEIARLSTAIRSLELSEQKESN